MGGRDLRDDEYESWRDTGLKHAENEAKGYRIAVILYGGKTAGGDTPNHRTTPEVFPNGKSLQGPTGEEFSPQESCQELTRYHGRMTAGFEPDRKRRRCLSTSSPDPRV